MQRVDLCWVERVEGGDDGWKDGQLEEVARSDL